MALIAGVDVGLAGLKGAIGDLDRTARRVASAGADLDPATAMVELLVEEATAKTNLAVIRTGDEMVGSLLDIMR